MDRTTEYQRIVRRILSEVAGYSRNSGTHGIEQVASFDDEHGEYLLVTVGWQDGKRVHNVPIHVRVKAGQVRVEEDWTDLVIADRLRQGGVAANDLVLGFQPPEDRTTSTLAVA